MSDPMVESCQYQVKTDSGKIRCLCPDRPYYFCKTNRRDNVCPIGLTTTYDDPEPKPERPFTSCMEESIRRFHEGHETNRWNLSDPVDSYLLYYQLDALQFNYFILAMELSRAGHHRRSHVAWGKHGAYRTIIGDLFPYRGGGGLRLSGDYQKLQRVLAELEECREEVRGVKV